MKRKLMLPFLAASLLLLLTGCFFRSPEDLYAVPKAPEDYKNLQAKIDEVRAAGAEYAAPLTGSYTQTIQLRDLDGDGIQEAVVFFRVTTSVNSTEKPLKIYIFRQQPDDTFEAQIIIEGEGNAINSIAYEDLDGDGVRELVVSWVSSKSYELTAYSLHGSQAEEIMRESYTDFSILDLDKDNVKEVVLLNVNTTDSVYMADFYDYDPERSQMRMVDSAPMTKEIVGLADVRPLISGFIKGAGPDSYEPALFVTSNVSSGLLTDVFAWREGHLVNITLNPQTGMSEATYRLANSVGLRDINNDSLLELPRATPFPDTQKAAGSDNFWSIQWMQYDIQGNAAPVFTTYYNGEDGWYLVLPEAWSTLIDPTGGGQKITMARRDVAGSGERAVVFSLWNGRENADPEPFLTVYKLTGPNRLTRSLLGNRFVLTEEQDAIYAAEFTQGGWPCGLTAETLATQFHRIQPE